MLDIIQLFYPLENKIIAYLKLSKLVTCSEKHITQQLSRNIEFGVIEDYVYRLDQDDSLKHLNYLRSEVEKMLFNDNLIKQVASHDDNELIFGDIDSASSKIKTELNYYYIKLSEYIRYIKNRSGHTAPQENSKNNNDRSLYTLKASIIRDLTCLEFDNTSIFDKLDYNSLIKNIEHFVAGNFELISPTLNFCVSEKNYAYYLIHSIQSHSSFSLNQIKNISINGTAFSPENCSKAMVEINKKTPNNSKRNKRFFCVKDDIDNLINENRQEFK